MNLSRKNKLILLALGLALAVLDVKTTKASEVKCLSGIMNAEAGHESFEGLVAVGEATIAKARRERVTVCKLKGVKRSRPPKSLGHHLDELAQHIIAIKSASVARGADHWNTGKKPQFRGDVKRVIGGHVLYRIGQ